MRARMAVDSSWLGEFCRRWRIAEFSLFGSALRDDFGPQSDIDILIEFESYSGIGFFELSHIEDELEAQFGRRIDLVIKSALRPKIRDEVLASREVVFGAA